MLETVTPTEIAARSRREAVTEDGVSYVTRYLGDGAGSDDASPDAFLVQFRPNPGCAVRPHFHKVAQFQVIVGGDGHVGKHAVTPITFHYTDHSTPYGPITPADEERGIDFLTLRSVTRKGIWWMPGSRSELADRAGREHRNIVAQVPPGALPATGHTIDELIAESPDRLAAFLVRLAPGEAVDAPSAAGSGGQYHLVARGSLTGPGPLDPLSLLYTDEPARLVAGPEGAEVLILQFPVTVAPE